MIVSSFVTRTSGLLAEVLFIDLHRVAGQDNGPTALEMLQSADGRVNSQTCML